MKKNNRKVSGSNKRPGREQLKRMARNCNVWMNVSIISFMVLNVFSLFVTSFIITVISMVKVKRFFEDAWVSRARIRGWMALWLYVLSCACLFSYGFVKGFRAACESLEIYGIIDYAKAYETFRLSVMNVGANSVLIILALAAVLMYLLRTWFVMKKELSKYL